jgi:hypothetical protein
LYILTQIQFDFKFYLFFVYTGVRKPEIKYVVRKPEIKYVYEPDIPVARQALPGNLANFDYFFLIVAEVYSPGEFYWFLSENRKPIEDLTDDMT